MTGPETGVYLSAIDIGHPLPEHQLAKQALRRELSGHDVNLHLRTANGRAAIQAVRRG